MDASAKAIKRARAVNSTTSSQTKPEEPTLRTRRGRRGGRKSYSSSVDTEQKEAKEGAGKRQGQDRKIQGGATSDSRRRSGSDREQARDLCRGGHGFVPEKEFLVTLLDQTDGAERWARSWSAEKISQAAAVFAPVQGRQTAERNTTDSDRAGSRRGHNRGGVAQLRADFRRKDGGHTYTGGIGSGTETILRTPSERPSACDLPSGFSRVARGDSAVRGFATMGDSRSPRRQSWRARFLDKESVADLFLGVRGCPSFLRRPTAQIALCNLR